MLCVNLNLILKISFPNREIGDTYTKIPQGTKAACPSSPSQRATKPANSLYSGSETKFGIECDTASSGDLSLSDHYEDVDKLCSEITVQHLPRSCDYRNSYL